MMSLPQLAVLFEVFGCVFVLSRCFLDFAVGEEAFVMRLSQISSFISYTKTTFY